MQKYLTYSVLAAGMTACTSLPDASVSRPAHVAPLAGSPIVEVSTEYTGALECIGQFAGRQNFPAPRVAVGHITDLTGADDALTGRRLTQGATLMAISAVEKSGMRVVERYDMGVIQVELEYAQNGLLRDAPGVLRETKAGQVEGADLYIVGGITEYNPNIRSRGKQAYLGTSDDPGGAISAGLNEYIIDVGMDIRMIDTRSTEVIGVRSFRKQVRGQEIEAGVFSFFGGTVVDIGGGQRALEPVQTAVRAMIERSVYEFMTELYGMNDGACLQKEAPQVKTTRATPATSKVEQSRVKTAAATQPAPQRTVTKAQDAPRRYILPNHQSLRGTFSDTGATLSYVEVGQFTTQSSAQSTIEQIRFDLPESNYWPTKMVEYRTPRGGRTYAVRFHEYVSAADATGYCNRLTRSGQVCSVRLKGDEVR